MCQVSYSRTEDLPGVFLIGVRILAEAESVLDYYSETRILRYQLVSMHVKYISCNRGIYSYDSYVRIFIHICSPSLSIFRPLTIILYLVFLFTVTVVLLNVLIAQVSNTYSHVQSTAEGVYLYYRCVSVCVCVWVWVCTRTYYNNMDVHWCVCECVCVCACVRACVGACVCACVRACVFTSAFACACNIVSNVFLGASS